MGNNWLDRRESESVLGPAAFLGVAAAAGTWLWLAQGDTMQVSLASAVLASTALVGIVWQVRARAARRWRAALDAYVERQIAQERRRKALRRVRTFSTALGVSGRVVRLKKQLPGPSSEAKWSRKRPARAV